jgi:hypothetical protein
MRSLSVALFMSAVLVAPASGEVVKVTVTTRAPVANGQAFGKTGPYEKVMGSIEFAIDPANPRNAVIADLTRAPKDANGRVRFTSNFHVLQPVDPARGNGVLLFDIANRGRKPLLGTFNRAPAAPDPMAPADFGDGFLMREGYTVVWVGWQFDVAAPLLHVEAPLVNGADPEVVRLTFVANAPSQQEQLADLPAYAPVDADSATNALTVRDRFWDPPTSIPRDRWRIALIKERLHVSLDSGFEPGRFYELAYLATGARVAGVGLAAIRDAASAFLRREDMPVRGRSAYVFGVSQSGRFLRQFLRDGFNVDEQGRRVFAAVWPHIAGGALGSFNERLAMPGHSSHRATRFPFTDASQRDADGRTGGILSAYGRDTMPRVFYTNSSVEYWGQGRAAALTHTSLDGTRDVDIPAGVRIYLIAGSQHGPSAFPPTVGAGQQLGNPVPHADVLRALLRSLHDWIATGVNPPESRYPMLKDRTLVRVAQLTFPTIQGMGDPRTIVGPAREIAGRVSALPFLVPQVNEDGNELGGIAVADVAVPLGTSTGWNFRSKASGNPGDIVPLLGSFVPFAKSRAERERTGDLRPSIEERYRSRDDYLSRVKNVVAELHRRRYVLQEDIDVILSRAATRWDYATREASTAEAVR